MLKPGATLVVKTGERGALGVQQGKRLEFGAEKLSVFDTIGAGDDSFNAGYLLSRLNGGDLAASLAAGCGPPRARSFRASPRRHIRPGELAGQSVADACGRGERGVSTRRAAIVTYILAIWFVISFCHEHHRPLDADDHR